MHLDCTFLKINLCLLCKMKKRESWKLLIWYSSDDFILYVLVQLVNWKYVSTVQTTIQISIYGIQSLLLLEESTNE
jgi:hypothetical protein